MSRFYLRKTIGSWSAGTRVEMLNWPGSPSAFEMPEGMCEVRILAGDEPIIDVAEVDLVERGRVKEKVQVEE